MVLVFFAMSIAITIYTNLDNVMLGFMKSDIDVGYYTAAVKIKLVLVSVVTSVSTVLLPRASYYVDKGLIDEFVDIAKRAMNFVIVFVIPSVIYFMVFAKEGILLLSGEGFDPAIPAMQAIMPTLLFIGITNILGIQMLVPLGKEKQVLYSTIIGALIDLVINIIMIPKYGATGAALGTTAAELSVLIYQIIIMKDMSKKVFAGMRWHVVLIGTTIALFACIWVKTLELGAFFALALSAICFFGVYVVILLITKEKIVFDILEIVLNKLRKNS